MLSLKTSRNAGDNNLPQIIYQNVDIDISVKHGSLYGHTTLWLVFKNPVKEGDVIRLHSRYHDVHEVLVNGLVSKVRRKDGLRNFNIDTSRKIQLGEEMDLLYRTALEISRQGELEITIPNLTNMKYEGLKPIPKSSPKEVLHRFDKLSRAYSSFRTRRDYGMETSSVYEHPSDTDAAASTNAAVSPSTTFIQIRLQYSISPDGNPTSGIIFRRQPSFAQDLYNYLTGKGARVSESTSNSASNKDMKSNSGIKAVYTVTDQGGSLYDVDGVRCWLPCIDTIDQRAIFDISISVSRTFHVTCSGTKLAAVRNELRPKAGRLVHRFFTAQRIPAMQVGFFVGKIESYRMPLYQAKARVWVVKGIQDVIIRNDRIGEEHHIEHQAPLPDEKVKRALESFVSRDLRANNSAANPTGPDSATKRRRLDGDGQFASGSNKKDVETNAANSSRIQHAVDSRRLAAEEDRRLYFDAVHHTMLALDTAVRLIHKFTGHKLSSNELAIIFVPDLGQDFMAFEGMILIDSKFLHDIQQVYKELPAHMVIIEAYLYSWLKSTVPIAWYNLEFIIHGLVGYLKYFYHEEMDGEEAGQCYLHRLQLNLAALEKAGFREKLLYVYPENNHVFSRHYGEYLRARSTLLFLLLEHKIGGKDPMRLALKELIKSPLIFHESLVKSMPRQFASNSSDQTPLISPTVTSPVSVVSPHGQHYHAGSTTTGQHIGGHTPGRDGISRDISMGNESVYSAGSGSLSPTYTYGLYSHAPHAMTGGETPYQPSFGLHSPYHPSGTIGTNPTGYVGNMAGPSGSGPVATGDLSPYVSNDRFTRNISGMSNRGALSPRSNRFAPANHGSNTPHREVSLGALSPLSLSEGYGSMSPPPLGRQGSLTSYQSWEQIAADILPMECLTADSFVQLFQYVSDTFEDFGTELLKNYIEDSRFGLYNVRVRCDDGKKIIIRTEQVGYDHAGDISRRFCASETLTMLMIEECDDFPSKIAVTFGDHAQTYEKAAYTRPGRRKERALNVKDRSLRSALDLVRTADAYTVKYTIIDPTQTYFADVFYAYNDMQLIEMLFGDFNLLGPQISKYRTLIRAQALQSLIHSDASSDPRLRLATYETNEYPANKNKQHDDISSGKLADKSVELEILALQECVLNNTRDGKELDFPLALRIEAIYGLATWQNFHAPELIKYSEDGLQNTWPGMEALIECIMELFADTDTDDLAPIHLHDEDECALRYAMLLALSTIRSKRGYTPPEVIDVLLLFAEYLTEEYAQRIKDLQEEKIAMQEAKRLKRQQEKELKKKNAAAAAAISSSSTSTKAASNRNKNASKSKKESMDDSDDDDDDEQSHDDDDNDNENRNPQNEENQDDEDNDLLLKSAPEYNDAQYRAILFVALGRIRFENMNLQETSTHPMYRIVQLAKATIQRSFGDAKVDARIAFDRILLYHEDMHLVSGTPQLLPRLPDEGLVVAAAMTCLSEMDVQATLMLARNRATPSDKLKQCDILPQSSRVRPYPFGIISGFNFLRCIVPPQHEIFCTDLEKEVDEPVSFISGPSPHSNSSRRSMNTTANAAANATSGASSSSSTPAWKQMDPSFRKFMQHYDFFLCSPLIRATAFECFARNAIAMHIGCQERSRQSGIVPTEPLFFSAAIVEALDRIQSSDPSWYVRQEAAWSFQNVLLERPARVVLSALLQSVSVNNAFAVHDSRALSLAPQSDDFVLDPMYHPKPPTAAAAVAIRPVDTVKVPPESGKAMNLALARWQRLIAKSLNFQQGIRDILLRSWLTAFGGNHPPPAWSAPASSSSATGITMVLTITPLLQRLYEVYDSKSLDPKRLIVRVPRFLHQAQILGTKYVPTLDNEDTGAQSGGHGRGHGGRGRHRANNASSNAAATRHAVAAPAVAVATTAASSSSSGAGNGQALGLKLTFGGSKYD